MTRVGIPAAMRTRRGFLGTLATPFLAHGSLRRIYPPERVRYPDPATEFEVQRLTDPGHTCYLPPTYGRVFGRRGDFLVYAGDRDGSFQAYALDLKSWESRQLTEAKALDRGSLTLTADDRAVCFVDAGELKVAPVSGSSAARKVYGLSRESKPGSGVSCIPFGPSAIMVDGQSRLLLVHLTKGDTKVLASSQDPMSDPIPRPRRASVLYRTGDGGLWIAHLDASRNFRLKTAPGRNGPARWAPDGRTILYLSYTDDGRPNTLREHNPDTGEDRLVAPTTQFVQFSSNADASVFVGASGSKASPYVLLLLRAARRELTLCEHRCANPSDVAPIFSPNSQQVFFQSERHGKPALYAMNIDKLVEKTEDEEEAARAPR